MDIRGGRLWGVGLWLSVLSVQVFPLPASANIPFGACCLDRGGCSEIDELLCTDEGGTFAGDDTICANVNCHVAAPVISILGIVGIAGAMSGLGVYTLLRRRRRG